MSLPRYGKYKHIGVASLGAIPVHWEYSPLKRVVSLVESGVSVNAVDEPASSGAIGVLKTSCVYSGSFVPAENKAVVVEELDRVACHVKAGTLIVSRMNTPALVGAAGLVLEDVGNLFLPDRLWQVHFSGAFPKFVHYWTATASYRAQVQMACAGTSASMQNLSQEEFLRFMLPLPAHDEQTAISTFLDRETAKIDVLIAEQEKLIALLAEKRQVTISHAVTKGLNLNAPMKDSGVAWLGEVPAHWEVTQLKRLCNRITDGAHISPETEGGAYSFVSTKDLDGDSINFKNCLLTSPSSFDYLQRTGCRPASGDVLFSKDGTIGRTVVVRDGREFVVASSLIIITPSAGILDSDFLNYLCKSSIISGQVEGFVKGAGLPRLSIQNLLKVVGLFPPIDEQWAISAHLKVETGKFDVLSTAAERAVALLKERRAALITAAVTGQIDVRGAVSPAPTERLEAIAA